MYSKTHFLGILFLLCFSWIGAQERITQFDVHLAIDSLGSMTVTENITVVAEGNQIRRGIVRQIPLTRADAQGEVYSMDYQILSIRKGGQEENYHREHNNGDLIIKIGNADVFLSPGTYKYSIVYRVDGQIGFYEGYDEIYWNITGNNWDFAIEKASASVHIQGSPKILQASCYTGNYGSLNNNCSNTDSLHFTSGYLPLGEGLTVAVGFEKGFVKEPPPPPPPTFMEKYGVSILAFFLGFILLIYYVFTWKKYGVDPPKPTVVPQWEPPRGLSPAAVGMWKKENYWKDLATASLVNLAVKGFLKIEEKTKKSLFGFKSKSYELLQLNNQEPDSKEEKVLFDKLFKNSESVEIDGKYDEAVFNAMQGHRDRMDLDHGSPIRSARNLSFLIIPIFLIILFFVGVSFLNQNILGGVFDFIFTFFGMASPLLLFYFFYLFFKKVVKIKFPSWFGMVMASIIGIVIIFFLFVNNTDREVNTYAMASFTLYAIVSFFFYKYLIKRPTEEQLAIQSEIEGLEMYMKAAEEKTMQFHNPPEVTPERFEKLLPYAIALGIDDIWGDKFSAYLKKMGQDMESYSPTWYGGYGGSFNPHMGHIMASSMGNQMASSSNPPSSSSGGGWSSGSGGGGFSGGGGGGGGGGGW